MVATREKTTITHILERAAARQLLFANAPVPTLVLLFVGAGVALLLLLLLLLLLPRLLVLFLPSLLLLFLALCREERLERGKLIQQSQALADVHELSARLNTQNKQTHTHR